MKDKKTQNQPNNNNKKNPKQEERAKKKKKKNPTLTISDDQLECVNWTTANQT